MRQLPKGHSDFKEIRQEGLYYIDKSLFIAEIIADKTKIILLPRPRRFGKTINLSLLKYFFQQQNKIANRALFEGLKIVDSPYFEKHQGHYPVIDLSFKGVKFSKFEDALEGFQWVIEQEFRRHSYLLKSNDLSVLEKADFQKVLAAEAPNKLWFNALKNLSSYLHHHFNQPAIILLDEYDTPIQAAWLNGYYDEMIDFMRVFLGEGLKGNPHLYKSVITGIMRVSKESIFSGLNNVFVYTITSEHYSDKFGFTAEEINDLIEVFSIQEKQDELKSWYNGYKFGSVTIYNPWSIVNYVSSRDPFPRPYWINTSDNGLIRQLIFESNLNVNIEIEDLIKGKSIQKRIDENIVFRDLSKDDISLFSFLYFAGYLKHERLFLLDDELHGDLTIPNTEVRIFYKNVVESWLKHSPANHNALEQLLKALLKRDIHLFERLFSDFVRDTLSYFDTAKHTVEAVYQAFLLGMLINLAPDYEIESNRESGYGRYDVAVIPKDKSRLGIIMELKKVDNLYEETKDTALAMALKQLKEKEYEAGLRKRGIADILILAVTFDGKRVWVKEG